MNILLSMKPFRNKLADYLYKLSKKCRIEPKPSVSIAMPQRAPQEKKVVRVYNRIPPEFEFFSNKKWFPYAIFLLNEPQRFGARYLYECNSADLFFRNWFHVLYEFMMELENIDEFEWIKENRNASILVLMRQIDSIESARLAFKAWIDEEDPKSAYHELRKDLYAYEHPHPVPPSKFEHTELPF